MTDLPGGPTWLNGQPEGDAEKPEPAPAGGPFAAAAPPQWQAPSEAPFSLEDTTSGGNIPSPPLLDSPWVDPLPTADLPSVEDVPLAADVPAGADAPPAVVPPAAAVPPPSVDPAPPGSHHLFNGPPPLFASDQPYVADPGSSASTRAVDQSIWTTPEVDGFDDLTAPRQPEPTPLTAPINGTAKTKSKLKRSKAPATPAGGPVAETPKKVKTKAKGKSANESNLPKLLAALGVTVLIAAIALFALGRGDDADTAADSTLDTSAATTAAEPAAEGEATDPAATDPASGDAAAADPTAGDPAAGGSAEATSDPSAAPANAGDEEAARALLAEVWANAGTKRDVHSHLMTTIAEMEATGDPSAVRVAAAAAANAYRAESELWNSATERISAFGDPYRTSLLMLKRANEVMLAGADELSACETCTADQALALARNGERLTSDGMADIIAILPPVVSQAEAPPAG